MMDLIDRYLTAIRWNLPGAKADDIIAELRDVIASRIEDREEALGRPLTRDETSDLLRDFGHPLVVAGRYSSQQHLIGPETFPFYFFVLKLVMAICAALIVLTTAVQMIFNPVNGAQALSQGFHDAWWTLLGNAALVTLIFAGIERTGWLSGYLRRWKPEQLPDLSDLRIKPKKAWEGAFEAVAGIGFLLWWAGLIHIPSFYSSAPGLRIEPAPVWTAYYWPIFALIAARVIENLIQWLRPRWRLIRAVLGVTVAVAGVALLAQIYKAGEWVVVVSTGAPAQQVADIQQSLHLALGIAFVVVGVVWVLQALGALWRLWRVREA
jgi:hypothetical protein